MKKQKSKIENEIQEPNDRLSLRTVRKLKAQMDDEVTQAINKFCNTTGIDIKYVGIYQKQHTGQHHQTVQAVTELGDLNLC